MQFFSLLRRLQASSLRAQKHGLRRMHLGWQSRATARPRWKHSSIAFAQNAAHDESSSPRRQGCAASDALALVPACAHSG